VRARLAVLPVAVAATVAIAAGSAPAAGPHAAKLKNCDVNSERLTYFPSEGAAGTMFEKFRLRHRGKDGPCTLRGYPDITLLGKHRKVIPIKVHKDHSRKVRTRVLKKGQAVWFVIAHPSFDPKTTKPCTRKVYRFRILFPNHSKSLTVKGFDPVRFCETRARVTPFGYKPQA
jgi:hypothetical protein